ncbi:MAG TPA: PRC-barrel domain-containing protein [Rubrobacter sp.]|nr:PRC-barrel domain-containing protein [Rubrobacter sp.]
MSDGSGGDRFRELEQAYSEYTVYDQHYEKVGKIDDIFVDANDEPEYIGVKTGFLGMKSTLIPIELVRVNDRRKLVEVAADEETIKHAPTFDDDGDITPEYEDRVHGYFGLERPPHMQSSGGYGGYYDSPTDPSREEELRRSVDTEYGERTGSSASPAGSAPAGTGNDVDVPLGDRGPQAGTPREEPAASTADPLDADAATRTGGDTREGIEVQGDRKVRVYKRAARPSS